MVIPVAYIVLMGMAGSLHQKKESSFGNNVLEVLQIASTIWPISFAAVLGPFLKTLALYGAEKGSTLGALEFLSTSQTTASTLMNFAELGGTHFWTVAIVLAWSFSPLGGQAAVRSLGLYPNSISMQTPAIYYFGSNISTLNVFYNATQGFEGYVFSGGGIREDSLFDMRNNVAAAFSTPDVLASHANGSSDNFDEAITSLGGRWQAARTGRRDLWRNVRVPFMELLPQYDAEHPEVWVPVPTDMVVSYASLIGIPIRGGSFSGAGNSTMVVRSHYQTVSCGTEFNGSSWLDPTAYKIMFHNLTSGIPLNYQIFAYQSSTLPNIFLDTLNDTEMLTSHAGYIYPSVEPRTKLKLIFGGDCFGPTPYNNTVLRTCDLSTSYVDVEVNCTRLTASDDLNCQASRVRHTSGFPIAGNLTALSNLFALQGVLYEFPWSTAEYDIARAGLIEMYLKDPPQTFLRSFSTSTTTGGAGCFKNVSLSAFETRFATALNTVLTASLQPIVLKGADGTSLKNRSIAWQNTTATWTEFTDSVYVLNNTWFAIWLVSTLVLFISAGANIGIRAIISAPDFLEGVAGLTRDSHFVKVPQDRSGESGSDRLLRLKATEVRICDVQSDAEVGKIALTTDLDGGKLDWGRLYE